MPRQSNVEVAAIDRAANALCAWLREHVSEAACQELDELHPDTWRSAAEVAMPSGPSYSRWGRMASVRASYDVPAYRGREVLWLGGKFPVAARIISSTGSHLYVRDANGRRVGPLHPCWRIDYLDGRGDRTGQPTPMDRAWAA